MRSCRSPPPGPLRSGHEPGALQGAAGGGGRRRSRRSADFRPARPACRPREGDRFGRPDRTLARAPVRGGPRRCGGGGGGRSGADAEVCIPGLAGLRPAPCVARRAPLHPLHRTRRHVVLRSFQQHRRPATTLRVGWSSDLSLGSTRTRRLRERPSSSASPKGPRAVLRCALSTEAPETGSTGSVLSPGKRAVDTEVWGGLYGASRRGPEEKRSGSDGLPEV